MSLRMISPAAAKSPRATSRMESSMRIPTGQPSMHVGRRHSRHAGRHARLGIPVGHGRVVHREPLDPVPDLEIEPERRLERHGIEQVQPQEGFAPAARDVRELGVVFVAALLGESDPAAVPRVPTIDDLGGRGADRDFRRVLSRLLKESWPTKVE